MTDSDRRPSERELVGSLLRWSEEWEAEFRPAGPVELAPRLVAGNRYGSAGLVLGFLGFLCSLLAALDPLAWLLAPAGVLLSVLGFVKYWQGAATNQDTAVIGGMLAWIAMVILLGRMSLELQIPGPVS